MKEKIQKLRDFKFLPIIILSIIIVVQIGNICNIFVNEKKLYHCDEIYSYGLANGFYQPFIESENVYSDDFQYVNKWFSGEVYKNYITVQEGQRFRYDSVWYNQSQDRHPPLFYTVLHTICSFFPDTFSFWFGFIPNLIYFAVTQIFLYKLARNILKSRYLALLFCLFWGFTSAAVNNTLFIRMYCMLTMWTVILMYLHSKMYVTKEKDLLKQLIPIIIVTALGGLTQYLFYIVAFIIAVCFCLRYLFQKRFKIFFAYGFSMLGGVLIAFAVFPASIGHMFSEGDNAQKSQFLHQITLSFRYMFSDIFSMGKLSLVWLAIFLPPFLGILIVMSLPLLFLFRKSPKLRAFFSKIKQWGVNLFLKIRNFKVNRFKEKIGKVNPIMVIMLLAVLVIIAVSSYTVSYLIGFANRYLYIIYPFAALFIFALLCMIFSRAKYSREIMTVLSLFLAVNSIINGVLVSYWSYDNDIGLNTLFENSNVVVVFDFHDDAGELSAFSYELYNAENVFITDYVEMKDDLKAIGSAAPDVPLYVMLNTYGSSDDEKGKSFYHMAYNGEVNQLVTAYAEDYMNEYIKYDVADRYEYIGEYQFIKGDFLVYRLQ